MNYTIYYIYLQEIYLTLQHVVMYLIHDMCYTINAILIAIYTMKWIID